MISYTRGLTSFQNPLQHLWHSPIWLQVLSLFHYFCWWLLPFQLHFLPQIEVRHFEMLWWIPTSSREISWIPTLHSESQQCLRTCLQWVQRILQEEWNHIWETCTWCIPTEWSRRMHNPDYWMHVASNACTCKPTPLVLATSSCMWCTHQKPYPSLRTPFWQNPFQMLPQEACRSFSLMSIWQSGYIKKNRLRQPKQSHC